MSNPDWEKVLDTHREMDKFYEKNANVVICKNRQIGYSHWLRSMQQMAALFNGEEVEIPSILLGKDDAISSD